MRPLVFVRSTVIYPISPCCTAYWTASDWAKVAQRVVEPLVLDYLGKRVATGERNNKGQLLYQVGGVS